MADNMTKYGFRFHSTRSGSGNPSIVKKAVASAYQASPGAVNVDLNIGDPVKLVSDGTVALAAAGDAIYGVIAGIEPYYDGEKMARSKRLPGGTTYGTNYERQSFVLVIPAENAIFEVDCDEATTATTFAAYQAFIGENADHALSADSTLKKAFPRLDISGHGTATAQWRIHDISGAQENQDYSGNYVKLLVVCNEIQVAPYTTTGV